MRWIVPLLLFATFADATPVPKYKPPIVPEKKEAVQVVPDLAAIIGTSNYGIVTQRGREVFFSGHPTWEASGVIRDDGTLLLIWTIVNSGAVCPGVYRLEDGQLTGHWGYAESVTIEPDGSLSGSKNSERLYRVDPPVE